MMPLEKVYESLCIYDPRSPFYYDDVDRRPRSDCYCDMCFYGRDKLALEIIRLKELVGER